MKPKDTDYDRYDHVFVCPICDEDYAKQSHLKKHLQDRECSHDYPSVLRCPSCPDYGFERLSELFEHFGRQGCQRGDKWVENLVQSLEKKMENPRVQLRLDKDYSRLQADENRPGRLRVDTRVLDDDEVRRLREIDLVS